MFKHRFVVFGVAWMLGAALPVFAEEPAAKDQELKQIREEMQQLRQQCEQRLKALEDRLQKAEAVAAAPPVAPPQAPPSSGNAFNPKISLILDGSYASFTAKSAPDVAGFLLSSDAGPRPKGISLGETELAVEANIDHSFHGWTTIALAPAGGVSVEEAFINTLALPAGFALKFGRFFSDIGYQNHQHAHAWEFVEAPLVYRAMLANQLGDDGVQVRWLAPTDLFLELGGEVLRGAGFPSGGKNRGRANSFTGFVHLGGDAGTGGSWRLGLSHLVADADDRRTGDTTETSFTGSSKLGIVDAVYKWAPNGNTSVINFVGQAEYFYRYESGTAISDPSGVADSSFYNGHQQGFYAQGVYQFMPRWRIGARYDHLSTRNMLSNPVPGTSLATLTDRSHAPQRYSLMTDFSNSEFSRLRLQYTRDQSRPNRETDNQVLLQYIFSLGSHPAHQF